MQLVASIGLIAAGLFIVNVDGVAPDMRFFGWIIVAAGVFGLFIRFILLRAGRDQDHRGRPRGPGKP